MNWRPDPRSTTLWKSQQMQNLPSGEGLRPCVNDPADAACCGALPLLHLSLGCSLHRRHRARVRAPSWGQQPEARRRCCRRRPRCPRPFYPASRKEERRLAAAAIQDFLHEAEDEPMPPSSTTDVAEMTELNEKFREVFQQVGDTIECDTLKGFRSQRCS